MGYINLLFRGSSFILFRCCRKKVSQLHRQFQGIVEIESKLKVERQVELLTSTIEVIDLLVCV